jgi:hypothetical protein
MSNLSLDEEIERDTIEMENDIVNCFTEIRELATQVPAETSN